MSTSRQALIALVLLLCCVTASASSQRRALVIGNDSYPGNTLQNARNDARAMATQLKKLGYVTTLALDVNRARLIDAVDTFASSIDSGDDALIYYAGHGVQAEGENMLVPTDFQAANEAALASAGYPLSSVLGKLMARGARAKIVILDACRNNPYRHDRSFAAGWSAMHASADAYLAFGTAPGQTASDESQNGHGLFTSLLLKHLDDPIDVDAMFRIVRLEVLKASKGAQIPWTSSSLIDNFHLNPRLDADSPNALNRLASLELDAPFSRGALRAVGNENVHPIAPNTDQARVEALTSSALEQIRSLHLAQALPILEDVIAIDPHAALALRLLGLILHLMGRHEDAQTILGRAVQLNPDDSTALAYLCLAGENVDEGQCRAGLQAHPELPASHLALAMRSAATGDYSAALPEASASISSQPDSAAALMLRAHISLATHQEAAAEKDLERANDLVLSTPRAFNAMSLKSDKPASPLVSHSAP